MTQHEHPSTGSTPRRSRRLAACAVLIGTIVSLGITTGGAEASGSRTGFVTSTTSTTGTIDDVSTMSMRAGIRW